jgi:hypothetical protein
MTAFRKRTSLILSLGLLGAIVVVLALLPWRRPVTTIVEDVSRGPEEPSPLDAAPPEIHEFLSRVMEKIPAASTAVTGYQFWHWEWKGKPTDEAVGLKAILGSDPDRLIARVMDVDSYVGNLAHVEASRSENHSGLKPREKVHLFQVISVPRIARIQHELALVDAGTIKGYRVAYWYLLKDKTESLDPKSGARSDSNIGAWLAAPGVVGYALSSWPKRDDVNALQWISLTSGANAIAKKIVEDNIDGMAAWAKKHGEVGAPSR